jgi:DNA-binding NarL/FixJ family response regulator
VAYVLKTEPPQGIIEAIRSVVKHEPWLSSQATGEAHLLLHKNTVIYL